MWVTACCLLLLTVLSFAQNDDSCVISISGHTGKLVPLSGTKLMKLIVKFDDRYGNPLITNDSNVYDPRKWSQATSKHGQTLLSLSFDYDVLSLWTLSFGVQTVDNLTLKDNPEGCFGKLPYEDRIEKMRYLLVRDSLQNGSLPEGHSLCYEVIKSNKGYGTLVYNCCRLNHEGFHCYELEDDKWIDILYWLVSGSKLLFFLLGPLILEKWFFNQSIKKTDYLVTLTYPLRRNVLIKKASPDTSVQEPSIFDETDRFFPGHFSKFKQLAHVLPSNEVLRTEVERIHLQVDHTHLLDDQSVPVGPFLFLWQNIFQCGLMKYEPFRSCCAQSIIGSWDTSFLCIPLGNRVSVLNKKCRRYLNYGNITGLIAAVILILAIPLPFYLRLLVYFRFEDEEVTSRHNAVKRLGLTTPLARNWLHYFTPFHPLFIIGYFGYVVAFVIMLLFQKCQRKAFEDIVLSSLQDLRNLSRVECIRLILSHLLLPFEKFGICVGAIVAVFYYPFALPMCVVTAVFYMVPIFYLTGRLILQARPWVIRKVRLPYVDKSSHPAHPLRVHKQPLDVLSLGVTSFESCMMLNNISPQTSDKKASYGMQLTCSCVLRELCKSLVGILCVVCMLTTLLMYAECTGFLLEVFIMILMGAVVNAGTAANFVMVAFWCIMYSINCYNSAYKLYLSLHKKVFDIIKAKLSDAIKKRNRQRYRGYKYFTLEEQREKRQDELDAEFGSEMEISPVMGNVERQIALTDPYEDTLEYIDGQLFWRMRSLVLFIDRKGTPRIPLQLFEMVCGFRGSGCPGPVYKGLLDATKQFGYMVAFLVFVVLVVIAFDNVYQVSSTSQLMVTLAGGFIPFVVRFVLDPNQGTLQLEETSFQARLNDLLRVFVQVWPVHDLTFVRKEVGEDKESPTHVDLVVTVKDTEGDTDTEGKPAEVKLLMRPSVRRTTIHIVPDGKDNIEEQSTTQDL